MVSISTARQVSVCVVQCDIQKVGSPLKSSSRKQYQCERAQCVECACVCVCVHEVGVVKGVEASELRAGVTRAESAQGANIRRAAVCLCFALRVEAAHFFSDAGMAARSIALGNL